MTTIGAIFTSTCHTKQLNPWPNSSASRVVILSRLPACQGKMRPFKDYPGTRGRQTGLRERPEWKQTVQLSAVVNTYPVGALMQLTDGDEKCVLKLCAYKTPFGKSGHIYHAVKTLAVKNLANLANYSILPSFFTNFHNFHNIPYANGLQFTKDFSPNFLQSLITSCLLYGRTILLIWTSE